MFIIGTTGHIDHGKSSLVKALTSIDPDRLPEEKKRGMTIDIGFAWLPLSNGETAGFIDVPGHRDFMKNVIAGLWGVNASLLVVAGDDGWMPQTEEHLNILNFFNIRHGIVALSKIDLVQDAEWLDLVEDDIRGRLAGTSLAGSPIVRVSARDGVNLDVLRRGIEELATRAGQHADIGKPRLYIDRAFTITGSGTVVTGTLIDGELALEQKVRCFPGDLEGRIRGIESYNQKVERGRTGCRVAINLAGVKKGEIQRGDILFDHGRRPAAGNYLNVSLTLLDTPQNLLKDKSEVHVYLGTREELATVKFLQGKVVQAGESAFAQLAFKGPVATSIGDRFILRRPSPALTIGGGVVLVPQADKLKYREADFLAALLTRRLSLDLKELIRAELEQHRVLPRERFLEHSRHADAEIDQAIAELTAAGELISAGQWLVGRDFWAGLDKRVEEILAARHAQAPIEIGTAQAELMAQLESPKEVFDLLVAGLVAQGRVRIHGGNIALGSHKPALSKAQEITIAEILRLFEERVEFPPNIRELLEIKPDSDALIRYMSRSGLLVEMEDGVLFEAGRYQRVRDRIIDIIRQKGSISIQAARDEFGYTRKYVIPLFNKLDNEGITLLKDNERVFTAAFSREQAGK